MTGAWAPIHVEAPLKRIRLGLATTLGLSALLCGATALPASAAPSGPETVVSGLVGPLHLTFSRDTLYIADTFAGQVIKADPDTGHKRVLASGIGASSVSIGVGGGVFAAIGEGGPGVIPSLVRLAPGGPKQIANLLAYEKTHNPDGQPQQTGRNADTLSNPYDVLAQTNRTLVADAAANDILSVRNDGTVTTLTVLPVSRTGECAHATNNGVRNGGCDPVPTGMAVGPDGYLYVSGLGAEVEGHVWKIDQSNGKIVAQWNGLPPLTGIAVGGQGSVYVSSLFVNKVFRLSPSGAIRSSVDIQGPTGVQLHDGDLYAGSVSLQPGQPPAGSVVRVPVSAFFGAAG